MGDKIIWKNARHSARDYLIYLLTVILCLSLVYSFNLLVFSDEIMQMSSQMNALTAVVIGISFVVVWVVGWLIHYMARFMLERRSREFGTYMLLGIPNNRIADIFIKENILMGGLALAAGLVLGSFLYQILAMIVVHLFHSTYRIHMIFSLPAFGLTLVYTLLMYGNSMLRMRRYLKKVEIHELLYADKHPEQGTQKKKRMVRRFAVSLLLEITGCVLLYVACHADPAISFSGYVFFIALIFILVGIYGIYTALTSFLTKTMLSGEVFKYGKDRLFLLRGLTAKLNMIGKTLGIIALLLTLTLTATQLGVLFERFFSAQIKDVMGFEAAVSSVDEEPDFQELKNYIDEKYGLTFEKTYPLYLIGDRELYDAIGMNGYVGGTAVLAQSDFEVLWRELGYEDRKLEKGHYLLVGADKIREINERNPLPNVKISGEELELQAIFTDSFHTGNGFHGTGYVIVVEDALARTLPVYHTCLAMQTEKKVLDSDTDNLTQLAYGDFENGTDFFGTNAALEASKTSVIVVFAFAFFYIGLIFACVAATVLAVQQLSEANRYQYRYDILSKLGLDNGHIERLILKQMMIYFLVPVLVPIPLSIFLSTQINKLLLLDLVTTKVFFTAIGMSIGLFLFIYFIYFVATYLGYKKKILENSIQ